MLGGYGREGKGREGEVFFKAFDTITRADLDAAIASVVIENANI